MEEFHNDGKELLTDNDENYKDAPLSLVLDEYEDDTDSFKEGDIVMDEYEDDAPMFKEGDIVMVMRKKVEWPAAILCVQEGEADVKIFNKTDTKVTVALDQI